MNKEIIQSNYKIPRSKVFNQISLLWAVVLSLCILCLSLANSPVKADDVTIKLFFIKQNKEQLPKLSNLHLLPDDDGVWGGDQGIKDSNTAGQFTGQHFTLESDVLKSNQDARVSFTQAFDKGIRQFVMDVSAEVLLAVADSDKGKQAWFYNVGAPDDHLRVKECRANIIHIVPSYAMQTDALAQYLISKKWNKWFLVVGRRPSDINFAAAMRKSAKKFGGKIVLEKKWEYGPDMRRTAASTVPVFTQGTEYDVLVVADVLGEFGEYLMYRTWEPRPVVGTQGLMPKSWHRSHEQWGSAQIQGRFFDNYKYYMSEKDYNVWMAIRSVSTAATRVATGDNLTIVQFLRGTKFALAAYKGQKLTFRPWNMQLRQPILLVSPTSLVSVSPQKQFLHERSMLDTLGYDKQETACKNMLGGK